MQPQEIRKQLSCVWPVVLWDGTEMRVLFPASRHFVPNWNNKNDGRNSTPNNNDNDDDYDNNNEDKDKDDNNDHDGDNEESNRTSYFKLAVRKANKKLRK